MEVFTIDKAKDIMKSKGYIDVSHNQSGDVITSVNFIKHLNKEISIHAKVVLKSESVILSFLEMSHLCELKCGPLDIHHKEFEKFEQIMMVYSAKCLDVDVYKILALLPTKNDNTTEGVKPAKKDMKTRKREFWDEIVVIGKKRDYPKDECKKFYDYWTQSNPNGTVLMFEVQKRKKGVFDIGGRLATWMKNDKTWQEEKKIEKKNFVDKKIDKQNKETNVSQVINKDEIF